MTASLKITADPADVRRAFAAIQADARKTFAAVTREGRASSAARAKAELDAVRAIDRTLTEEKKLAAKAAAEKLRAAKAAAAQRAQAEREVSRRLDAEAKARIRAIKAEARATIAEAHQASRARQRAEQDATRVAEREARRQTAIFRQMVRDRARHQSMELRRVREDYAAAGRRREERREALAAAGSVLASVGAAGLATLAAFGDDARAQAQVRRDLDLRAAQIAAGDIGNPAAARELVAATERTATSTGLDPLAIMTALGEAQSSFSQLASAGDRAAYLNDVLPMLARAALATGSSLQDIVQAAGEYQRQLGVSTRDLPRALAQSIAAGRLGSISFGDAARHMGAIGGSASRFLSNRPEDALQSLATTNALFQFGGRGGGGGDVSATRTRAFLSNLTSARGQERLRELVGHEVFDRTGQIVTRPGESQQDAFLRTIEEAYARSGGNANRFLTGVAGINARSRELGTQLFNDLRAHGGRLVDFRAIASGVGAATDANTILPAFQAIAQSDAIKRSIQDNQRFFRLTGEHGQGAFAVSAEDVLREFRLNHPVLGALLDNPVSRVGMDLAAVFYQLGAAPTRAPQATGADGATVGDVLRGYARRTAEAQYMNETTAIGRFFTSDATREQEVAAIAARRFQELTRGLSAETLNRPVALSSESIQQLAERIGLVLQRAPLRASTDPYDQARADAARASAANRTPAP
jgi:hypothetical protein